MQLHVIDVIYIIGVVACNLYYNYNLIWSL